LTNLPFFYYDGDKVAFLAKGGIALAVDLRNHVYENALQQLDSGVLLFDSGGTLCFTNQELLRLLEISEDTLQGYSLKQLMRHPALKREFRSMIVQVTKAVLRHKLTRYELMDVSNRHWLITITNSVRMGGYCMLTIKDVSVYKDVEQTTYQQDKLVMLGQISAAIAHEIRNPLTAIRGFIQLLKPYLMAIGKEEYSRIILTEIDRANDIIYEFLNSSKPTKPEKSCMGIHSLLREVIMLIESEALMRGCQIRVLEESITDWQVAIDVKQMKQVMLNLMKNSMDAICESGKQVPGLIELAVKSTGEQLKIMIRDNGKGMSKLAQKKLFEPFYTTKPSGTGLGLSVSERIIKNHGGSIQVDSQVGVGTEFTLTLPVAQCAI